MVLCGDYAEDLTSLIIYVQKTKLTVDLFIISSLA